MLSLKYETTFEKRQLKRQNFALLFKNIHFSFIFLTVLQHKLPSVEQYVFTAKTLNIV